MSNDSRQNKPSSNRRSKRPSISLSGKTYERLRLACPCGSLAAHVENMIVSALDDPKILDRLFVQFAVRSETEFARVNGE